MIKWTYCTTGQPEYYDLIHLSRVISYQKRRMYAIKNDPAANGYADDPFTVQEAVNDYIKTAEALSDEYRYMVMMYFNKNGQRCVK